MLRPEAPSLIPSALVADPSLHLKADPSGFQATPTGATSPKPTDFGLARSRRNSCALPEPLLTALSHLPISRRITPSRTRRLRNSRR